MRRLLLAGSAILMLACAGLTEGIIEGVTGESIELREDGMELTLPGDGQLSADWGPTARHPAGLTLSPPTGAELQVSGSVSFPGAPSSYFAVYATTEEPAALIARYRVEMEQMGLAPTEKPTDEGGTVLSGERGELTYFVSVEGSGGAVTVSLGVGSEEAIEQGLNAAP